MKKLTITIFVEDSRLDILKEDLEKTINNIKKQIAEGNEWGDNWSLIEE